MVHLILNTKNSYLNIIQNNLNLLVKHLAKQEEFWLTLSLKLKKVQRKWKPLKILQLFKHLLKLLINCLKDWLTFTNKFLVINLKLEETWEATALMVFQKTLNKLKMPSKRLKAKSKNHLLLKTKSLKKLKKMNKSKVKTNKNKATAIQLVMIQTKKKMKTNQVVLQLSLKKSKNLVAKLLHC